MARTASFLVLGADVTSVQGLCEALTKDGCHVVGMSFVGLMSYWRNLIGKGASFRECDDRLILVPPSYGTRLQLLTRAYLPAVITQCFKSLAREKPNDTWLILTNPIAERWTREVPSDRLIYWNYDDYSLYDPDRAAQIQIWEDNLLARARFVLCASRVQLARFSEQFTAQASKFLHFPNAVRTDWLVHSARRHVEGNTLGYVGNMDDRVDWRFVYDTASMLPNVRFIFVGGADTTCKRSRSLEWVAQRERALSLRQVEAVGPVSYDKIAGVYQSFAVNWMPYDARNPFNIACCPTKIFDALATGRPFISTDIPECRAYADFISIVHSAREAKDAISSALADWDEGLTTRQLNFARQNDWQARATFLGGLVRSAA